MRSIRKAAIGLLALGVLIVCVSHDGWTQAGRTIKIIISVPPGGAIDLLVRVLADSIGKTQGPTFVIESRPGAGSIIAADAVARATPDGNTLLVNNNGVLINSLLRRVSFDPLTSFEPICYLVNSPQVIVVNASSSYRSLGDLVDAARARPAEISIASVGPNTTQHLAIGRLMRLAGVTMTYVPFTGGAPAINALLGNHVTAVLQNYSEVSEQLKAGSLRALATPSGKRIEPLPDIPTVAETYKDFDAEVWFGLVAPAKTPPQAVSQLIDWVRTALQTPDVKSKLVAQALYPDPKCGGDFANFTRRQLDQYASVIRDLDLKTE